MAKKTTTGTAKKKTAAAARKRTAERHSSGPSGLRSLGKKMDSSRHGFETQPAARKKAGAYGQEDGRKAKPKRPGTASRKGGKGGAIAKMKAKRTR